MSGSMEFRTDRMVESSNLVEHLPQSQESSETKPTQNYAVRMAGAAVAGIIGAGVLSTMLTVPSYDVYCKKINNFGNSSPTDCYNANIITACAVGALLCVTKFALNSIEIKKEESPIEVKKEESSMAKIINYTVSGAVFGGAVGAALSGSTIVSLPRLGKLNCVGNSFINICEAPYQNALVPNYIAGAAIGAFLGASTAATSIFAKRIVKEVEKRFDVTIPTTNQISHMIYDLK